MIQSVDARRHCIRLISLQMGAVYQEALLWDPSHYYSAINALAAVAIRAELGNALRSEGDLSNESKALSEPASHRAKLEVVVETALDAAEIQGDSTLWR